VPQKIYFDNAATTAVDPRVIEAMLPYMRESYGNASSLHSHGTEARQAMQESRAAIASCLGAKPEEIVFTGSGTEANNLALKGVAFANRKKGNHLIVSSVEHDCVLSSARWLEAQGFRVTHLPVDGYGFVYPTSVEKAIDAETILVSVLHANNEIGTVEPIQEIGKICREHGVHFHTDACQSFGKIPLDVGDQFLDLTTINAHKIYGPKGVAALYVRNGVSIEAWQHGGGQERGLRSATENVAGIVGFAAAARLCMAERETEVIRQTRLRERIVNEILGKVGSAYLNGHPTVRLAGNVNLGFGGLEGDAIRLLVELDRAGIAVSTGSACSSNSSAPSHVLSAIGLNALQARGALRVTLGRFNTEDEVEYLLTVLPKAMERLRSITSVA
jgi:cysteine desulfurase